MQLAALLVGSLSAATDVRAQSEAQLTALLHAPGFALQLCELLFSPSALPADSAAAQRQLACLLLKKLVNSYWVPGVHDGEAEGGVPAVAYLVPEPEKIQVKQAIVAALQHRLELFPDSKLQTALCLILTAIFERDWPDQWPDILPAILEMIAGQDKLRIEFAIRFLSLAGGNFSSENCCELVARVFPHLERVYVAPQEFPVGTRSRIVRIVQSCLVMVGIEAQVGSDAARQLLHENIARWISLFLEQLASPVQNVKDYSIKIQILSTLASFVQEWPKEMSDLLPQIMPQLYTLLLSEAEGFEREVVLNPDEEDSGYDSDGEGVQIGKSAMVVAAFEFVRSTVHAPTKKTRQLILSGLSDFVYVMIGYMQITVNQMEVWQDDPNKYVADEDDESLAYNVRNASTDLIVELEAVLGRKAVASALDAAQKRLKADTPSNNWRLQEAALLVVGCLASPILDAIKKNATDVAHLLDLSAFLQTLFKVMNAGSQEIYLRARALWCASRLARGMSPEMLDAFLQVAVSGLEQSQVLPVRMYACRAIGAIVKHDVGKQRLQQASGVIIDQLTHLAELATDETLHIALETLVVVLQETEAVSPEAASKAVNCFLHHWGQHLNDPLIAELIDGAFSALLQMENQEITRMVHEQTLPAIRHLLTQSVTDLQASGNGVNTAGSAITILKTLFRYSFISTSGATNDAHTRQIGEQFIQHVFEPLIAVLGAVEDEKVLNSGAECLKWLIMFSVESLGAYTTSSGSSGIDATMNISAKLLSPNVSDASAVCVGGLITQILLKLGTALPAPTVQSILSAVCNRLAVAELPSLIQSLCMVFARLVHSHGVEILNVLEQLPPPQGVSTASTVAFVFGTWIEKQQDFYGLYCIKVTMSALVKVVEWNDPRINAIAVAGSPTTQLTSSPTGGVQTRSKARSSNQEQFTQVHFLTKFAVTLAKTMSQLSEEEEEWVSSDDESSDGEGAEADSGNVASGSSIFAPAGTDVRAHFEVYRLGTHIWSCV